ncbi:SGNH/GDSL hydrolase family protein [Aeromicrobium sp.]|uniref:SGNH/GDSL hydrolase family protein n=1 Tax=Aeromicrobium sp. TaxID=1871063 RepID=UPI0035165730
MHRTPRPRPRLVRLAAVCAGPVLALGLVVAPTTAQAVTYVALGDSYSSGLGTRSYLDDGTECRRSAQSYPALVAAARGWSLDLRACSGATIPDVRAAQLGALSTSTQKVTLSVGGNDAGFADVLTECALPAWASDCDAAIDQAQATISGTLPSALSSLYAQVGSRAPSADVVVVGYPRVFMGEDCNALTWFSPEEQTRLNATADRLNSLLATRASAAGFRFANPTSAFTGHAVCDDPEWLNGLSNPVEESYHPNVAGHRDGYAPLVGARVASTSLRITAATEEQAEQDADVLTDRARRHTAADRRIEPQEFQAPDLDSPRVQRAARRLGIDTSDRAEVDRFDRRFAAR